MRQKLLNWKESRKEKREGREKRERKRKGEKEEKREEEERLEAGTREGRKKGTQHYGSGYFSNTAEFICHLLSGFKSPESKML